MKILIKGAEIINPKGLKKGVNDILLDEGVIIKIAKDIKETADTVINAKGLHVLPGLVDMHCHLREPGYEYREDILSGTKAAVKGGFTSVACMPNTLPIADNAAVISYIVKKAKEAGLAKVYPIGAITKGQEGVELAEMAYMKKAGAIAVSDDGKGVANARLFKNALLYAKNFGMLVISHCEDLNLTDDGLVSEGYNSTICGLKGIPRAAEETMIARDIITAEYYGARLHIAHVSTEGGAEIIRQAKKRGVAVTAETCPHYFGADDSMILGFDPNSKVKPPLRTKEDCAAIIRALEDGTIDAIATDHAPYHIDEKNVEYANAAFGISGFETAFSLAITHLYNKLGLDKISELMSYNPAQILGIPGGVIMEGETADLIIADINETYVFKKEDIISKGKNSPFIGQKMTGKILHTIAGGKYVFAGGKIL